MVVIYSFDGELDDKLRLEHLLLHWPSKAELVIVAGQRYDGNDTYQELKGVINEVLACASLPNGRFATSRHIRLIRGGPLSSLTDSKVDPSKSRALESAASLLEKAIGARPFVFHNNTSFSLLDKLLGMPVGKQVKGCSFTCSTAAPPGFLFLAANANWDRPAFERVLEYADRFNVPCLSMHGSLAGWKRQVLPELPNWPTTMLAPAATEANAVYARKVVRFGMGVVLDWAICAYASAKSLTGSQTQAIVDKKLASSQFAVVPGRPKLSDGWASLVTNQVANWSNRDPARDATTFRAMSINANLTLSNTVGDLSGCPIDVPLPKRNKVVILRVDTFVDKGLSSKNLRLGYRATIGSSSYSSKGGLYIMAYAKESETLNKAWSSIRLTRAARRQAARWNPNSDKKSPILNEELASEWKRFIAIFQFFLRGTLDNIGIFPSGSKAFIDRALVNLEKGDMTRMCEEVLKKTRSAKLAEGEGDSNGPEESRRRDSQAVSSPTPSRKSSRRSAQS